MFHNEYVGEMAEATKGLFRLFGGLNGEMSVEDIPVAPGVDIEAIKAGDSDPYEVVVEIPVGKSKRGWNYTGKSLKDIVDRVNSSTLNGFLGHQKPEDVSNQFVDPVTHWVGAKMTDAAAYFRGVIDPDSPKLKRWIKSGRIKQVSIFGRPQLQKVAGETHVIGYDPLSIDWTPLDRPGMPTRIVAASGEMWDLDGEGPQAKKGDEGKVEWATVMAELKKRHGEKGITIGALAGEMGLTDDQVVQELTPEYAKKIQTALGIVQKAQGIFEINGEMTEESVESLFKTMKAAHEKEQRSGFDTLCGEMMDEKVKSDEVKKQLKDPNTVLGKLYSHHMAGLDTAANKEAIAGEMDKFLADQVVKGIVDSIHTQRGAFVGGGSGNQQTNSTARKTRSTSI